MNIIIVGSGKVGSHIAEQLVREKHDVTIIDLNDSTLQRLADSLDIMTIKGNGVSPDTLKEARADVADLVIAATSSDEVNMVCCLTAKQLGAKYTIARIRTPEYTESIVELKSVLTAEGGDIVVLQNILQHGETLIYGLGEVLFLNLDQLGDVILLLSELGISGLVLFDDGIAYPIEERLLVSQKPAVTGGSAEQTAQDVSPALI